MSFILGGSGVITDPVNAPIDITANTAAPYYEGIAYQWSITNLDDYTTYTLSSTNGTITRASATLTYTPSTGGAGGWTMNGRIVNLTILPITNWLETLTGVTFRGYGVATNSSNDIFVNGISNVTRSGLAVAKFDSKGTIQWQRRLTASYAANGYSCVLDSSSNVYLVGGSATTSGGAIVAKYDTNGTIQAQNQYNDAVTYSGVSAPAIDIDSSGNVYVCGQGLHTATGFYRGFIFKLNSSLNITWQKEIGEINGNVYFTGVTVDSSGNVYAVGWSNQWRNISLLKYNSAGTLQFQVDFGPFNAFYPSKLKLDASGNIYILSQSSPIIAKLNSSGVVQWQRSLSSSNFYDLSLDSSGNIYVVGDNNLTGNSEYIIAKYDGSGVIQWQRRLGTTGTSDTAYGVSVDSSGNIVVNGYFGGGSALLARLPADGSKTGTYTVGASTFVYAASAATDAAGTMAAGSQTFQFYTPTYAVTALGATDAALTATATRTAI